MIVIQPNVTDPFTEGDTVTLACTASGVPYPTVQWYKDGVLLTNDSLTTIYNDEFDRDELQFTSSILELCSVNEDDIGTYSCLASNSAGNDSIEFDVQVRLGTLVQRKHLPFFVFNITCSVSLQEKSVLSSHQ